jgi:DNA adenine methylase
MVLLDLGLGTPNPRNLAAIPFLKWAGGKSVIADKIISRIGALPDSSTYFEPFLGGGAVFFRLRPERAVLIDSNRALIETYRVVKDHAEDLILELDSLSAPKSRKDYEERRNEFNDFLPLQSAPSGSSAIRLAALFIWLNHTCYNGLYRVNKEGKFNVPFGQYEDAFIYDPLNVKLCSVVLNHSHARLESTDYRVVLTQAVAGDTIYFDPPYHPLDETSSFTSYTSEGFGTDDQEQLAKNVMRLIDRGCRVVVSNSPTPEIRQFYRGLRQIEVLVPRAINCVGTGRSRIPELLIFPKSRMTLHDQWEKVVTECDFKLDGRSTFEVTAARVKKITGEEPRLVAKMDTREDLPRALAQGSYFVLPVSGSKYAIVPGDGYHDLEKVDVAPIDFHPERDVPVTVALQAGESAAIQTALYTGLLERVIGVPRLRQTLHNDKVTLKDVTVTYGNSWSLPINGARVEVDAGFENHDEFFVFECKNWRQSELSNFNIRQLFFPQVRAEKELRTAGYDWKIRSFFLDVEPNTSIYRFWEYGFTNPFDYASIHLERVQAFRLIQDRGSTPGRLLERLLKKDASDTNYVPQANDATKLLILLQGVAEGYTKTTEVAKRFRFDPRQSNYYGEAAEELGLLERHKGKGFALTDVGDRIARLPTDQATQSIIEQIFTLPVFRSIAEEALRSRTSVLYPEELLPFVRNAGHHRYNETTLRRRSQSVASWLNWIGEATGTIRVRTQPRPVPPRRTLESFTH